MSSIISKELIKPLQQAMYDFTEAGVRSAIDQCFASEATIHLAHPLGDSTAQQLYDHAYQPLVAAIPDLERRDTICIAGTTEQGQDWIGCAGYYTGVMRSSWLDIPPTGHQVAVRFHEFYQIDNGVIVQMQSLWDIPDVMMQARAWPMVPSLGREWLVPGPATADGLQSDNYDPQLTAANCALVIDMLNHLKLHPKHGGPEVMEMARFWHPKMNWYGPAGIGTARGITGFRHWHQIPFLRAMPDRGQYIDQITYHFFAQNNYVGVTGWPNMIQTITHDGWLGIAPVQKKVTMRSLDFWRIEKGLIRENWVMVDVLDVYQQIGIDVFARLREFNKARNLATIPALEMT